MPIDILPDKIVVPTRDELVARWERDVKIRSPGAQTGDGTLPTIDGKVFADQVLPIYAEAQRQGENASLESKTSDELKREAKDLGLPEELPAAGASGFLIAETSVGGANVPAGTQAFIPTTGVRYEVSASAIYTNGQNIPITGIDTGPQTNLVAGTTLQWENPPAGLLGTAKVFTNSDGSGLTGGREEETDAERIKRIRNAKARPAVAANDADYQKAILETPGIGIQAPFTYPSIAGPGTSCSVFTIRPQKSGLTRVPNNAQIAAVRAYVIGKMPKDDAATFGTLLAQLVELNLRIRWLPTVVGWADAVPWPPYAAGQPVSVQSASSNSALLFLVGTAASPPAPQAGQTIAFYDTANLKFIKKRIASVTGSNPWTITVDSSNNASDLAYAPATGEILFPWSDSLDRLVAPVATHFDALGPGEQKSSFFDEGFREKRSPASPAEWPSVLTNSILTPMFALAVAEDVQVVSPTLPFVTTVGTANVQSRLLELSKILVYPL